MNKITDFHTVLEIAFGINAIFYSFELTPYIEQRFDKLLETHRELVKKKIEATKNTYVFPITFLLSNTYPVHKYVVSRLSLFISALIIGILIYSSFYPDAELPTFSIWSVLVPAFGLPVWAFRKHSKSLKLFKSVNRSLEWEIREAQTKAQDEQIKEMFLRRETNKVNSGN